MGDPESTIVDQLQPLPQRLLRAAGSRSGSSRVNRADLTVLIIAQNEELKIGRAIESGLRVGQVLVIDGGSRDSTIAIAKAAGARVIERDFDFAARQYNFGLEQVTTKWAFILDADERVGIALADSIAHVSNDSAMSAFWTERLNYFVGKPINHSGWRPDKNVRLVRVSDARYDDREVHARMVVGGELGNLTGPIHHFSYGSIDQYLNKLNQYTSFEVDARQSVQKVLDNRSQWRALYLRLPFKGTVRFIYMYVLRAGFLDGRVGLDLARMSAFYERVVSLKSRYKKRASDVEPDVYP